ncbi:MAG TPA: VOC family protein [Terricaulis sp.]|nr:VOC family protein [Terricaulis sp.]
MTRGALHHLDLTVRDVQASKPFYAAVLGFMGYVIVDDRADFVDFKLKASNGHPCFIGIAPANGPNAGRAHDRYSPGLHHVAWAAEDRDDVDALYAVLQDIGATILNAPAEYPQYSAGYYAVFFADPDGLKLEYVHKP